MSLMKDGVLSERELEDLPGVPKKERLEKRAVAVIECAQEIPCNPCEIACQSGAIYIGEPITNLPSLDAELCNGCGLCISACPGQAIFVIDKTYSKDEAIVKLPFEFLPLPEKGQVVAGLNRQGEVICSARVIKVHTSKSFDRTSIISVVVPVDCVMQVRNISLCSIERI